MLFCLKFNKKQTNCVKYYSVNIDKILVANRGEIACRIIKTAKKMGIRTVAVYSDADAHSHHTKLADEAFHIGPSPSGESYLRGQKLIEVAKLAGAQAIHPGYGFLSENAGFADSIARAGLIFIGPPSTAISAMGSKTASKNIMIKAGVPVVPGYHGADQSLENFAEEADKIGYPVLIKASHGGGGKGMRIVHNKGEMSEAMDACKREGIKSFGSDDLLIEKYLLRPRHIEVQIFADKHGNCVYLFERDCSVQRRHQKIIEEAPAPGITPELRAHLGQAAVNAAKAVGYVGAGTVEFIVDDGLKDFYFMEMNTRLQVEHPITEMITRQDLVSWQIKVAEGQTLPLRQEELKIHGHAFEARVYAENPKNDFLPGSGKINLLHAPSENENVRVDTGIVRGDEISVFYDPMISKLIVWDENRHKALRRLSIALSEYHIAPIITNLQFLQSLTQNANFQAGLVHTGFIKENEKALFEEGNHSPHKAVALASIAKEMSGKNIQKSLVPTNFTINSRSYTSVIQKTGTNKFDVTVVCVPTAETFCFKDVSAELQGDNLNVHIDGRFIKSIVYLSDDDYHVKYDSHYFNVITHEKLQHTATTAHTVSLKAPMPGRIIKVLVQKGDTVKKGQAVVILEAMKMEHKINSPKDGVVKTITYEDNAVVALGATLLVLEEK